MGCFQGSCNLRLGLVENPRTIDEKEYHSDNSHNSNQKTIIIKEIKEIKDKEIIENIIKETDWSRLKTEKLHGLHDHSHYDLLKKFKSELNDNTHPIDLNQLKLDLNISNNFIKKFPNKDPDNPNSIHSLKQNSINKDQKKENQTVKEISLFDPAAEKFNEKSRTNQTMSKLEKLDEPKTSQPSQGSKSSRKKGALRLETKHLSMLQEEKKQNDNSEIKEERKVSMIDLNNRKSIDYDHTLSPTTKIKIKAEIFIHLKQGTIDENYSIGELLGEGAYGKVNVATHKLSGILRALKTIKKQDLPKEDEAKLFSEMNLLKTIDHPNIIKLIELFQDDKYYYLITEYCSGGELFDRLKKLNQFSEDIAADIMKQILSAITYLHSQNVVHRDLKPENIVFESKKKDANLKIIDFGTSRRFDNNEKPMSKIVGTPYFIAPEVLNKSYNEKCDIWSCGVILYILLCGYPPFFGRTQDEIMRKVKEGKYKMDTDDWSHVSQEAKNLIQLMLDYDYHKRISACDALNNKWITSNTKTKRFLSAKCLQNLSSFHASTKLNTAILTFIANNVLTAQDKDEIRKTFQALDKDCDGFVSSDELIEGYSKLYKDKQKAKIEVEKILKSLGCDENNKIDYTQFIIASVNKEKLFTSNKLYQAFKMFDQDGDGNISKSEIETIMGGTQIPEQLWKNIINQCDNNSDGEISYGEFVNILLSKISNNS